MTFSTLLATAGNVPYTPSWNPLVSVVMIVCVALGIAIANYSASKRDNAGTAGAPSVGGIALPNLVAGACFGHILGTGAILGLANVGVL
ncbi:photosystem I reaction center subunit PsaK [Oscillatoria sp. FACHB-1406]|uniref:photosystem I reaction center subunit PsaK n=1 Tax=Oscillatoria sp. FACHB-1406 TaxID=2692846 RepID=UPI001688355D|nr:photosystem I reaction center subunit PsaK [Oscillatoria sp. FACHB-1406]MBD2579727.1 photosystem I reaction center subunit PsaK [Oscillatoria sp. FACHB-1406]